MKPALWNRRDFLATTISAATVTATGSDVLAAESVAPGKGPIGVGFLGAVHSHALDKLRAVQASRNFKIVGVCEESTAARQNCEKLGLQLVSQAALLAQSEVVVVESAVRDHARHGLLVLKAGKHVHVEKPPATTLSEMQEMVALAREKKLVLQTGYMWRYHPGFTAILEAARNGWLGELFLVRAAISNFLPPARRPEWGEFKGGSLFELGSHLIDATVRLLGKPKAVTPFLRRHGGSTDSLKDNNVAVLEYDKALALITNTALQPAAIPQRSFEVIGSNGSAILQPIEPPELNIELVKAAGPYKKGLQAVSLPRYKRFEDDIEALAAAVRGERPLSVTLDEELAVQETLLKASDMM
jgi:predicted dehydrogenase